MANFFWIDETGLLGWDDASGWSSTSGGLPNTTAPTTGANVFFDSQSPSTPVSGPSAVSIASLNTTGFGHHPLPSLSSLTITATLTLEGASTYDGDYGVSVVGVFTNGGANEATGQTLLSGTFTDAVNSSGTVTTAIFNGASANNAACTTATFNGVAANNAVTGTVTTGIFNSGAYNDGTVTTGTLNGASANQSTVTNLTITSNQGSNATGTVSGTLTVPGIQSGSRLTMDLPVASLGTFAALSLTGASTGGTGGPLGGPEIRL